jgi:hypothetical protein
VGDEIVWHVASVVKRRSLDQLFCSYLVHIPVLVALICISIVGTVPIPPIVSNSVAYT